MRTAGVLRFGGNHNYRYGMAWFTETQVVDFDTLDYRRVRESARFRLEFVTSFMLESEHSNTFHGGVPWWWSVGRDALREHTEQVVEQRELYMV